MKGDKSVILHLDRLGIGEGLAEGPRRGLAVEVNGRKDLIAGLFPARRLFRRAGGHE